MNEAEARVLAVAARQYGVVERTAAIAGGMTGRQVDRRLATGRWVPVHPGVYRVAGAPVTGRQRAFAAARWLRDAVVSHSTAARLLQLDGVRDRGLHLTVPRTNRRAQSVRNMSVHRSGALTHGDRLVVDGIPCASGTLTLLQLAGMLDDERLERAFESARRSRLTNIDALARRAGEVCGPGWPGSARVRRLLAAAADRPVESALEVRTARLLRTNRLRPPAVQHAVAGHRVDFAWPSQRLAVECDGFEWHGSRLAWKRDRRRLAAIEAMGWRVVHVTWEDVTKRPSETVARVVQALELAAA